MIEVVVAANECIDFVHERVSGLSVEERLMVLCYLAEHCKAHCTEVLSNEYHKALH